MESGEKGQLEGNTDYLAFAIGLVVVAGLFLLRFSGFAEENLLVYGAGVWAIFAFAGMTRLIQRRLRREHAERGSAPISLGRVYRLTLPYTVVGAIMSFAPLAVLALGR